MKTNPSLNIINNLNGKTYLNLNYSGNKFNVSLVLDLPPNNMLPYMPAIIIKPVKHKPITPKITNCKFH